jgi:hypothetical protein
MAHVVPEATTTDQGNSAWRYIGRDERGRELEVIAVEISDQPTGHPFSSSSTSCRPNFEEASIMARRTPPRITEQTRVGTDVDLERDDIRLADGTRLTPEIADSIVEQVHRTSGRPSLSGKAAASPQIAFRVAPDLRDRAAELAAREGKTVSQLAREALEDRIATSQ